MTSSLVDRATSDALIGPDWAMNMEICDILNRDPGQAKDVVKGIKKRIGSRNPKVQLLALTLLETAIKNCGDIVHMHVAEKNVLHDMVKIVKKKPDFRVKEKVLVLIDTWQEAFGGPRARYPQYYIAYQELLRMGAVFPQRPEQSAPIFTPPQTQPLASYPPSLRGPDYQADGEVSAATDFPLMSMTEMQNARDLMDVLAEMLNALDPGNREGLKQEVIVDLVGQCRSHKQRVVHLVNTTSDEEMLNLGLSLNDDLQRVLAKHDAIAAGIAVRVEKSKPPPAQALVDVGDGQRSSGEASTSSKPLSQQPSTPAPQPSSVSTVALSAPVDPHMDLLSGESYGTPPPAVGNPLALVPVNAVAPSSSISDQNILALSDMFAAAATTNPGGNQNGSFDSLSLVPVSPQAPAAPLPPQQLAVVPFLSPPQQSYYSNGNPPNMNANAPTQYEQNPNYPNGPQLGNLNVNPTWNPPPAGPFNPNRQETLYGSTDEHGALPPPPWESQPAQNGQIPQPAPPAYQPMPMPVLGPQPPSFYGGPMAGGVQYQLPMPAAQFGGYGYAMAPPPEMQYYDPRFMTYGNPAEMYSGLSMYGGSGKTNLGGGSGSGSTVSQAPSRPVRAEDKLFGDLVSMAKTKPGKPTAGEVGSSA